MDAAGAMGAGAALTRGRGAAYPQPSTRDESSPRTGSFHCGWSIGPGGFVERALWGALAPRSGLCVDRDHPFHNARDLHGDHARLPPRASDPGLCEWLLWDSWRGGRARPANPAPGRLGPLSGSASARQHAGRLETSTAGDPANRLLFDSVLRVGIAGSEKITRSGFAGNGRTASVVQEPADGKDWVQRVLVKSSP